MPFEILAVGERYPGPVPPHEGAWFDVAGGGLQLTLQCPGLRPAELDAWRRGLLRYGLYECPGPVPLAIWLWGWPAPLGEMDSPFDARRLAPETLNEYLDWSEGPRNLLQIVLLDGPIVRGLRTSGLQLECAARFRGIIGRQLAVYYDQAAASAALQTAYRLETKELFERATVWRHRGDGQ